MWNIRIFRFLRSVAFLLVLFLSLASCTTKLIYHPDRKPSYALKNITQTSLARDYKFQIQQQRGKSGFVLLGSGLDAFAARTALFDQAEKSIDVQYYLVKDDLTGFLFYESLIKAANRGVRVRVLLDDQNLLNQTVKLAALDLHPNIEVRVFNPYTRNSPRFVQYVFQLGRITRRMHNKSVIVDNSLSIVGSRNIANEYSEAKAKRVFSGMEVIATGPVVKEISRSFDHFWNFQKTAKVSTLAKGSMDTTYPMRATNEQGKRFTRILETSPLVKQIQTGTLPFRWGWAKVIQDNPEKVIQRNNDQDKAYIRVKTFNQFLKMTKKEILIITPYFLPGQSGINYIRQLRERGIKISVLTNSYASTDMRIVNAQYNNYRKDLLRMGVKLYEFKSVKGTVNLLQRARRLMIRPAKAALHAKILSFDREKLYIGSMNMDPRSLYENTEIGVMIASKEITSDIVEWFDKNLDELAYHVELYGDEVVWIDYKQNKRILTSEPDTVLSQQLWMKLMSILPVESQL